MTQYQYVDEFRTRFHGKRLLLRAIAICALAGSFYGAGVGAAIAAVPSGANIIEIAAGVLAALCVIPAVRIGSVVVSVKRSHFGRLFLGLFAAVGGAIAGGFFAMVLLLALGAISGAVAGWILARGMIALRHDILRRFVAGTAGAVAGTFIGAVLWAINLNQRMALAGAVWGGAIGIVVGPLLLLAVVGAINSLAEAEIESRRTYLDTTFQRED